MHDAYGEPREAWRVSFIHVKPAGQRDDVLPSERSRDQRASMSGNCCLREFRHVSAEHHEAVRRAPELPERPAVHVAYLFQRFAPGGLFWRLTGLDAAAGNAPGLSAGRSARAALDEQHPPAADEQNTRGVRCGHYSGDISIRSNTS